MRTRVLAALILTGCSAASPADDSTATSARLESVASTAEAQLEFEGGWVSAQQGTIVRGGHVDVSYDEARVSACKSPTVFKYARFQPGGEQFSSDEALGFDVPADATGVQLWFHAVAPGCDQWDSDYGRNWRFTVKTP